jgi:hypothetical protein
MSVTERNLSLTSLNLRASSEILFLYVWSNIVFCNNLFFRILDGI